MLSITKLASAIAHPVRTAGSVSSQAAAITVAGFKTGASAAGWAIKRARSVAENLTGAASVQESPGGDGVEGPSLRERSTHSMPDGATPPTGENDVASPASEDRNEAPPATKRPARKPATTSPVGKSAPTKKAPPRKTPGKRTVGVRARTSDVGQARSGKGDGLDVRASDTVGPLLDPATAKAIRAETEALQRAADPDKS